MEARRSTGMEERIPKMKKENPSIHLGIDSPMVIWLTDLEGAGIGGGSGGGESGGGESGGGATTNAAITYFARCDEQHAAGEPFVDGDGLWSGPLVQTFEEARGMADSHGHSAYVAMFTGGVAIGPVVQH
jgi:hypothetical protein